MEDKQEKLKKILKKAVDIKKNSDLAIAREFVDLDEKIEEEFKEVDDKLLEIKEELKKKSELELDYQINRDELKGEDGKDYILTEQDKKDIAKSIKVPIVNKVIEKTVEKREIVKEQPIIYKNVTNEIKEVAKYEDRKQIIDKINAGGKEKIDAKHITGLPEFTREVVREIGTLGQVETPLKAGANILITTDSTGAKVITGLGGSAETFETVSKNLKGNPYTLNYTGTDLTSIVYTTPTGTITKTLNYTGELLTSLVLSGDTPSGINLTKTLGYTGSTLSTITYS